MGGKVRGFQMSGEAHRNGSHSVRWSSCLACRLCHWPADSVTGLRTLSPAHTTYYWPTDSVTPAQPATGLQTLPLTHRLCHRHADSVTSLQTLPPACGLCHQPILPTTGPQTLSHLPLAHRLCHWPADLVVTNSRLRHQPTQPTRIYMVT